MANTIQIKRGNKADLPVLKVGEFGFCLDTKEFYIGTGTLNIQLNIDSRVNDLITKVNSMPTTPSVDNKVNTLKAQLTNLIEALKEDNDGIIDRVDEVENSISDILDTLNNHTHALADTTGTLDASRISGVIDMANLPKGSLETIVVVANQAERLALTKDRVQNGDTVKENDIGQLFVVVDDTKLDQEAGYMDYTAGIATSAPWAGITGKPDNFIYGDESQLTTVSKRIVPAVNELKTLFDTSVNTINTDVTTLKTNVNTINTTLTNNDSKIAILETDVMGSTSLGSATYLKANLDSTFNTTTNIVSVPASAGARIIRNISNVDINPAGFFKLILPDTPENQDLLGTGENSICFPYLTGTYNYPQGYYMAKNNGKIEVFLLVMTPGEGFHTPGKEHLKFMGRDKDFGIDLQDIELYRITNLTVPAEKLGFDEYHDYIRNQIEAHEPILGDKLEIGEFMVDETSVAHTVYDKAGKRVYVDEANSKNQLRSVSFKLSKSIDFNVGSVYVVNANIGHVSPSEINVKIHSVDESKEIIFDKFTSTNNTWYFHASSHETFEPVITFTCHNKDFEITNVTLGESSKLKDMVSVFEAKIKEIETRIHALETKTP